MKVNNIFIQLYIRFQIVKWNNYLFSITFPMEKSIYSRYADSQDHLIITLNEQIETLVPLKDSYASLQRYHIKLTHDFESLLTEQVLK